MKILMVATLVTPDGAYGGPMRVAVNQARELASAGNDVTLVAGSRGFARVPKEVDGVPIRLFPARRLLPKTGFAGFFCPKMLGWILRNLKAYDVVHIHLARDLVTLPAAMLILLLNKPLFAQCHGMVDRSARRSAKALDMLMTRRALKVAVRVFYLTPEERNELVALGVGEDQLQRLYNGVPAPRADILRAAERSNPHKLNVLFMARLQTRKEPTLFARAAIELHQDFPDLLFSLVGPDEGSAKEVENLLDTFHAGAYVTWEGALAPEDTLARMAQADLYVLPSYNEPFPMAVLEAMSVGLPVVVSRTCGLAPFVEEANAGLVFDGTLAHLREQLGRFAADSYSLSCSSANAKRLVREQFSMHSVVLELTDAYSDAVEEPSR